jgi:hypothetical protein
MSATRTVIVLLALLEHGWLLFDGLHAFATGDYVTPRTGRFAGRLGPWSRVWEALGVDPRSQPIQLLHVAIGAAGVVCLVAFALGAGWARTGLMVCAVASLWYLPFGTLSSLIQLALLLWVLKATA